jgi:CRP-like cAMP-binding protein
MPLRRSQAPAGPVQEEIQLFDPKVFLASAGAGRTVHRYCPKQGVFSQGERADAVFYILEGRVRLSVLSNRGKEATIAMLGPGDFLGEGCLASGERVRSAAATAFTDCLIVKIEKKRMLRMLREECDLSGIFVAHLLERHNRMQADLVDQLFNSAEKRLARTLLNLAHFGENQQPETPIPQISQETLAEMVGTTRSRVNFFMNKFRRLGFIERNGGWQVHSSLLSVVLHE